MVVKKMVSKVQAKAKVVPKVVPNAKILPVVKAVKPVMTKSAVKPLIKPEVKPAIKPSIKQEIKPDPKISSLKNIVNPVQKEIAVKTEIKKKKIDGVNPETQDYFVYLKNPLEYRRHLLESCRKILLGLRSHQKIFLIRQKKLEEMSKLKVCVRELLYLNKKFNDKLPKYNTGFLEDTPSKDKAKPVHIKAPAVIKPAEIKPEKTEMDRLEESLANIEKKLQTLQ